MKPEVEFMRRDHPHALGNLGFIPVSLDAQNEPSRGRGRETARPAIAAVPRFAE